MQARLVSKWVTFKMWRKSHEGHVWTEAIPHVCYLHLIFQVYIPIHDCILQTEDDIGTYQVVHLLWSWSCFVQKGFCSSLFVWQLLIYVEGRGDLKIISFLFLFFFTIILTWIRETEIWHGFYIWCFNPAALSTYVNAIKLILSGTLIILFIHLLK